MDTTPDPGRTSPFHWNAEVRPGLRVAFTTAVAGNLALHVGDDPAGVGTNRRRLETRMGVRPGSLRFMSQTHSDRVVELGPRTPIGPEEAPEADGMVSVDGSLPLAVLVADCVPIVLADVAGEGGTGATAVVHAGRAGVGNGIVANAVRILRAAGALDLRAWIGPSVCGSCYEVPEDMMSTMAAAVPAAASRTTAGRPALDLPAAVRVQLRHAGARVEPLDGAGTAHAPATMCTLENSALFSHRREPGAGRIAGLVWRS